MVRNFFADLDTPPEDEASYAINLSGRSLSDPGTAEFILEEIGQYHDREKLAIAKAMHTPGQELGKQTIAEQAETGEELACLKSMGVDFVQGFLLHRPAPMPAGPFRTAA